MKIFFKVILYILFPFFTAKIAVAQQSSTIDSILAVLNSPKTDQVLVVAHRADWRNFPENSIEAIKSAIAMNVDMVEIDIAKTSDGHLVLMHDYTLDRTTNGSGPVSRYTLDSLKKLYLKDGLGVVTRYKIPTLEEAMLVAKGKILVNLDKCYEYFAQAVSILEKTNTLQQTVIKASKPYELVKTEFGQYLDKVIFMPIVDLRNKNANQIIDSYLLNHKPIAFELVFNDDALADNKLFEKITSNGSKIWINSLWPSLNGGHDDDTALNDIEHSYGWIVNKSAKLIQTDRPQFLLNYLKSVKKHK
jgi:glycerophosphoryl diester phosphodiesterase